jgi:hypothetical protein
MSSYSVVIFCIGSQSCELHKQDDVTLSSANTSSEVSLRGSRFSDASALATPSASLACSDEDDVESGARGPSSKFKLAAKHLQGE